MLTSRALGPRLLSSRKSILLLGARQTGKSTLIRGLKPDLEIDLADEQAYLDFAQNPSELAHRLNGRTFKSVFIDEVQRLPSLLNTLQSMIDRGDSSTKFYLTGSRWWMLRRGRLSIKGAPLGSSASNRDLLLRAILC